MTLTSPEMIKSTKLYQRNSDLHPQVHAKQLDKKLGFRIPKIEVKLLQKYRAYYQPNDISNKKQHFKGTQTWIGLHPQALQTPYNDLYEALLYLKEYNIETVVDIGAGYGRVGLVMNSIFPTSKFIGYEIIRKRMEEANRIFNVFNLQNCSVLQENVLAEDFIIPKAQIYFIYDFSEMDDICKILDQLSQRLMQENFFLITKGTRVDYLLAHKYKEFWLANSFIQHDELKIYSSQVDLKKHVK
jgi:16S rRNA G527 N7-methylase RsmG